MQFMIPASITKAWKEGKKQRRKERGGEGEKETQGRFVINNYWTISAIDWFSPFVCTYISIINNHQTGITW